MWCASTSHISFGAHDQIDEPVLAELGKHVVEERDTGVDLHRPGAVDVELDEDRRLLRRALDAGTAGAGGTA